MNNKGFTLIELVATIALLAIISIISFVSISVVLEQNNVNECENLILSIKSGAKEYVSDNRYRVTESGLSEQMNGHDILVDGSDKYIEITAKDLLDGSYLSSEVKDDDGNVLIDNPFGENDINPDGIKIKIKLKDNYSSSDIFVNKEVDGAMIEIDCSAKEW